MSELGGHALLHNAQKSRLCGVMGSVRVSDQERHYLEISRMLVMCLARNVQPLTETVQILYKTI